MAIKNIVSGGIWTDRKNLGWMDPLAKEVWDYNIEIAKDAFSRGFDEINFGYIRFPLDGDLKAMSFPFYDEKIPKSEVIMDFFKYLHKETAGFKISADLFGLSTINRDDLGIDLGIGQIIENAYPYFDFICPMIYPSHYASGFLGYKNPAEYPYEVVKYSMESALNRLKKYEEATKNTALEQGSDVNSIGLPFGHNMPKLRPWLQDFDLGADYDASMIKKQIQALDDLGLKDGWFLWSSKNIYTAEALKKED